MRNATPKIRIFVSSTFLDMQKERDILNQDVFPIIKGECDKLGVPFSVIDLRWGITEEDQAKGNVVDLCLEEIKHCKPYLIGLLGNRYGWCPEKYDEELKEKYGFIRENEDKSVTELEMLFGAVNAENKSRCFFYYKDPDLFDEEAGDHKDVSIRNLKRRIDENGIKHSDYCDYEEFRDAVLEDLLTAIEEDYPRKDIVPELRQEAFLSLEDANFVSRPFMMAQTIDIISYGESNHVPVAIYSPKQLGKTALLNRAINSKKDVDKIIINLRADKAFQYFPWYYLSFSLTKELGKLGINLKEYPDVPSPRGYLSAESYYQSYLGFLCKNLANLQLNRPLYILINDIDLLFENDASLTFFRHFLLGGERLPDNLYIYFTTSSQRQLNAGKFHVAEMHENDLENPKSFFVDYLGAFGKKIDKELLGSANSNLSFADYKYIADYLIYYCNFSSYKESAKALLSKNGRDEILRFILSDFVSKLSPKCASVFAEILIRLAVFDPGFSEEMIFASYDKKSALENVQGHQVYVELSKLERASIMRPLRYFSDVESGTIFLSDRGIRNFLKANILDLWKVIAATYEQRSEEAANKLFEEVDMVTKYGQKYSKEEYLALLREKGEMTKEIEYAIFDPLCAYLNKVIRDFAREYLRNDEIFLFESINEKEFSMLMIIQEAARLYKINTRADLYKNILMNKRLMYFIESRSHSLTRRLVKGFIDLNAKVQESQYGQVDYGSIAFMANYAFDSITKAEEKSDVLAFLQKRIIANIGLTLRESDVLDGKFLELVDGDEFYIDEAFGIFVAVNCQDEVQSLCYDLDYELSADQDEETLYGYLAACGNGYDAYPSVYDKIACAYGIFAISFALAEKGSISDKEYALLTHVCESIEEHLRYCYYPEIFAIFDMFFGRLYPKNILFRLKLGIDTLKSLGFQDLVSPYEEAYEYFSNPEE